jgi:hypothetical protein
MTKKRKQSKKAKSSKRTKGPAQPDEETDTATISTPAVGQQEVLTVETKETSRASVEVPGNTVVELPTAETKLVVTRSAEARAAIKAGIAANRAIGSPSRPQLEAVFGKAGYLLTWPKRTEKFGITPETFQAALL